MTMIFMFLFQFMIRTIEQLVGKGLSLWVITQLITLNLAWMLTLAVPMSVLVATLMGFGTLSSNNEITIIKASGVSLRKLMIPVLILAGILTYLMIRFNNDVLPEANHQARLLLGDISRTKPTFILESGKFSEDISGVKILVRKTFENSNNIEGIYIYDYSNPNTRNLVTAKRGDVGFTSDFRYIVMNLEEGEIHQLNANDFSQKYRKIEFNKHRLLFSAEGFGFKRSTDNAFMRGDREMTTDSLRNMVENLKTEINNNNYIYSRNYGNIFRLLTNPASYDTTKANIDSLNIMYRSVQNLKVQYKNQLKINEQIDKQMDTYLVEIYKKYSIPFACLVFALLGAPLGYRVKKGGFGIAAGLSLMFFLLYWASLIGGEKLADRDIVSPFLGMWLVNFVLGAYGLYLLFKSS